MKAANLKAVDIANHLDITDSAVSQWFSKDTGPSRENLLKLAGLLGRTVEELSRDGAHIRIASETKSKMQDANSAATLSGIEQMPRTVRIFRTDPAGDGYFTMGDDSGSKARRPSRYEGREDIIAVYVQGDHNEHRFRSGQLIYLETLQPPRKLVDDAVVRLKADKLAILGLLIDRTPEKITLKQYRGEVIEIPADDAETVFRVMTINELLG